MRSAAGVELMCIILKQKRLSRAGALKALDFATTRQPAACERLVDMGGLKSLFGASLLRTFSQISTPVLDQYIWAQVTCVASPAATLCMASDELAISSAC